MNFTKIPRSLIYEDRRSLEDFDIRKEELLNGAMYKLLRRHLYADYTLSNYKVLILQMFNEAYYLCTMFLLDKNADANFRDYIEAVMIDSPYPSNITDMCRRIIYAMCYEYLKMIAPRIHEVRTIKRHLRNCSYEYMPLFAETADSIHPTEGEFRPVDLTDDLLSKVDWDTVTNGYDNEILTFILESLGHTKIEKQALIISIYSSVIKSGKISKIPYSVDGMLFRFFDRFGGNQEDLLYLNEKNMMREKKTDLTSRITILEQEKINLLKRIEDLQQRNTVLTQEKLVLGEQLATMRNDYQKVHHDKMEHVQKEALLQRKLEEMNSKVQTLGDKVGSKTIQLKSLVDGLKRYAKLRGIEAGKDTFFSLNFLLMCEPAWVNNVKDLEDFFIEYEDETKTPLLQLENKQGGLIQIKKGE